MSIFKYLKLQFLEPGAANGDKQNEGPERGMGPRFRSLPGARISDSMKRRGNNHCSCPKHGRGGRG